jgi:hypothetical protein
LFLSQLIAMETKESATTAVGVEQAMCLRYMTGRSDYHILHFVMPPPAVKQRLDKLGTKQKLTHHELRVELTEWPHEAKKNDKCCRFNRYTVPKYKGNIAVQTYRNTYETDTVLRTCVLHCKLGQKCPNYYSRKDVLVKGFRDPAPALARCLYNELCPPHNTDCECAQKPAQLPYDAKFDTKCYCHVGLMDMRSIACRWDAAQPDGLTASVELALFDLEPSFLRTTFRILFRVPPKPPAHFALPFATLLDDAAPISFPCTSGPQYAISDTAGRWDREGRLREVVLDEVMDVVETNPAAKQRYLQFEADARRKEVQIRENMNQNAKVYQKNRRNMAAQLIRANQTHKQMGWAVPVLTKRKERVPAVRDTNRRLAQTDATLQRYMEAYEAKMHSPDVPDKAKYSRGPNRPRVDVRYLDPIDYLIMTYGSQNIASKPINDSAFLDWATWVLDDYERERLGAELD